jgi:mannose-6-phosphate isomerase-like protein (cupin superfamily)
MSMIKVNAGLARAGPASEPRLVLGAAELDDPAQQFFAGILGPGEEIAPHRHADVEEVHVVLDEARVLVPGAEIPLAEPSAVLAPPYCTHGVRNGSQGFLRYFRIAVGPEGFVGAPPLDDGRETAPSIMALDVDKTDEFHAHLGMGLIRYRRLWEFEAFSSRWGFIDHVWVPPGTSVGYHRHDRVQESYLILNGEGIMKVDGDVERVGPGDCVPNRLGGSHGLVTVGDEPVEFLNVSISQQKGEWDATDLGDDLSDLV